MSFEDFQDDRHDCHLGYWNGMILVILNLQMAPMPPNKFEHLGFGSRCGLKIFKMAAQAAILDRQTEQF